jgi:hypothetical protein
MVSPEAMAADKGIRASGGKEKNVHKLQGMGCRV